ncbi:DUF6371 domain-containing protein [Flagellimonas marina]|uniref:DUF6371 domain-containing protein n=1 Tax=Flagellimonas marina TaxID=1775168 RepID=A0ABV8PJN6_9FLAO
MDDLKLDSKGRRRVKYCPCNKSNRDGKFVPFIAHEAHGYCHSCGESFLPNSGTLVEKHEPIELPTFYHDRKLVSQSGRRFKENNFVQFLNKHFPKEKVKEAVLRYLIGTSDAWQGANVFWQIDDKEKVRHGKIMLYDRETGKRSKRNFNTFRNLLEIPLNGTELKQCLFGLHLKNTEGIKNIAIVESEKTAVIMSLIYDDFIWMATGGKQNFKYETLKPIKEFGVVAFPDKDAIQEWKDKSRQLNKFGFNIRVDDCMEGMDVDANTDLADIFLFPRKEDNAVQQILSKQDLVANELYKRNQTLGLLVEEFDLVHENGQEIYLNVN